MKFFCIIFAICCLITVEGQIFHQQKINTALKDNVRNQKPERTMKNRRHSFYNNHDDYLNAFQNIGVGDFLKDIWFFIREIDTQLKQGPMFRYLPGYYDNRPSFSYKYDDTLKELSTLFKELASQLKHSHPSPPQIIYVPYPVPATVDHPVNKTTCNVNITIQNTPKDTNQVGMDIPQNVSTEDDDDGSRPLSFKPKQPSFKLNNMPPPFDHGSAQAGIRVTRKIEPIYNSFIKRFGTRLQKPRQFK